jgi:hypothetical protein
VGLEERGGRGHSGAAGRTVASGRIVLEEGRTGLPLEGVNPRGHDRGLFPVLGKDAPATVVAVCLSC